MEGEWNAHLLTKAVVQGAVWKKKVALQVKRPRVIEKPAHLSAIKVLSVAGRAKKNLRGRTM